MPTVKSMAKKSLISGPASMIAVLISDQQLIKLVRVVTTSLTPQEELEAAARLKQAFTKL